MAFLRKILCNCGKVIETYYKLMLNSGLNMQKLNNLQSKSFWSR